MPRYVTLHPLACLTRQDAEALVAELEKASPVRAHRVQVNLQEGKMLVEFEAASREELQHWLTGHKFHFDWILRVEYELRAGALAPAS